MSDEWAFCPKCATPLTNSVHGGRERPACPASACGFVRWGNPTPAVAAILEHEGSVLLVRAKGWPEKMFGLVTGFLEAGESPEEGVVREVREELGLEGEVVRLVGVYPFELRNEVIIAFHVRATGQVQLGEELEAFRAVAPEKLRSWPFGTGLAVQRWLEDRSGTR